MSYVHFKLIFAFPLILCSTIAQHTTSVRKSLTHPQCKWKRSCDKIDKKFNRICSWNWKQNYSEVTCNNVTHFVLNILFLCAHILAFSALMASLLIYVIANEKLHEDRNSVYRMKCKQTCGVFCCRIGWKTKKSVFLLLDMVGMFDLSNWNSNQYEPFVILQYQPLSRT